MEQVYCERFLRYREQFHLTQEELAERIGVSRQTVSKWERGEASPDTENLLKLSKLYGVTIDTLLHKDPNAETANGMAGGTVNAASSPAGGATSDGEADRAEESTDGGQKEETEHAGAEPKADDFAESGGKRAVFRADSLTGAVVIGTVAVYLLLGSCLNLWHPGWLVFFLIPIFATFAEAIDCKQNGHLQWNILTGTVAIAAVAAYLFLGFCLGLWHPGWLVFLLIPLWAVIAEALDRMH